MTKILLAAIEPADAASPRASPPRRPRQARRGVAHCVAPRPATGRCRTPCPLPCRSGSAVPASFGFEALAAQHRHQPPEPLAHRRYSRIFAMMPAMRTHSGALFLELPAAARREVVKAGAPIRIGLGPARGDPAARLEPHEAGIEGAHVQLQSAARHLLEARRDGVAMLRPQRRQRLQNHQVERPREDARACFICHSDGVIGATSLACQMEDTPESYLRAFLFVPEGLHRVQPRGPPRRPPPRDHRDGEHQQDRPIRPTPDRTA